MTLNDFRGRVIDQIVKVEAHAIDDEAVVIKFRDGTYLRIEAQSAQSTGVLVLTGSKEEEVNL